MLADSLIESTQFLNIPAFLLDVESETITFRALNAVHGQITGVDGASLVGKTPHEALPVRMADTVMQNYLRCVRSKNQYAYDEVLALPLGEIWWRTRLTPIMDGETVTGIIGISSDITPSKETEKRLAEALEVVSSKNQDLQILASTAAHDVRGPMRQTKILVEMLGDGFMDLGDDKLGLLQTINDVMEKGLNLIDHNLSMVNETSYDNRSDERMDFGHWCADAVAILDPLKTRKIDYPHVILNCEKIVVDIALRNLLDNATKFSESAVAVEIEAADDETLHFTISDDGPGLPDTVLAETGGVNADFPKSGNNGVGLAASRSLIEARRGKLWVSKSASHATGASLSFSLPGTIVSESSPIA